MPDSNAKKLAQFLTSSGTYNLYDVQADSTGFFDLPDGTTAQRPTPTAGMIRFNSTINLAEYYDGTSWKAIDAPPTVTSISPSTSYTANEDITITGTNFVSGATVKFIGADATEYDSPSVTFTNSSTLVAQTPNTALTAGNEPYDVKVINTSGLSGILEDALDAGSTPAWSTSATLPGIYDGGRSSVSISLSASDPDGQTVTYAVKSGSALPSGLSLNTSTGAITGSTSAVGSDTTSTFTITASAGGDETDRTFSLTQYAPTIVSYTSVGSGTFTVPTGITQVDVLVVGAGGGGAKIHGGTVSGGGGAGGLIYRPAFPVTPGGSVSYSVGDGVRPSQYNAPSSTEYNDGAVGQNSTFGSLTALGGGGGSGGVAANAGGSGGGGGGGSAKAGSSGQQPSQPGDSGTYGFGNPGGTSSSSSTYGGGGGGGAGSVGQSGTQTPSSQRGGDGGNGRQYDISGTQVYYAGGGGGNSYDGNQGTGTHGGGNGAWGSGNSGTANRGGGGGASNQAGVGTKGGSGIVIVKY